MGFEKISYQSHQKILESEIDKGIDDRIKNTGSINYWRHDRMLSTLRPLISEKEQWLTVGDGIGSDAHWLEQKGISVVASNIGVGTLKVAHEKGLIEKYREINAENIDYADNSFDYILCKEAYHHFPRPYIALYEMIRCSKKAVVLIEPIDIAFHFPLFTFIRNIVNTVAPSFSKKIWKNEFSYETVGNFVYKVSEREFKKIGAGINLPYFAWKGINDYYSPSLELNNSTDDTKLFNYIKRKIWLRDFLCRLRLIPYQNMIAIIFKEKPTEQILKKLSAEGFNITRLPNNPYLS